MKVAILAGGLWGTRITEETSVRPKPIVGIDSERILWNIMTIYFVRGMNDFMICGDYKGYISFIQFSQNRFVGQLRVAV